jgi:hypothetical protein
MAAIGNYIITIRDRLAALHMADTAWAGAASDKFKVRSGNVFVRDGGNRQNFKRLDSTTLPPGWLPAADFSFRGLSPASGQANAWGQSRTFGLAAGANAPGLVAHALAYRVRYKAATENVAAALLCASEVLLARAGAKLANATAGLAALPYCGGAGLANANADPDLEEAGQTVYRLDSEIVVLVVLNVGPDLLGT